MAIHIRNYSLVALSTALALVPVQAHAQDGAATTEQAGERVEFSDIIVTANRREEAIQDVAVSISAFSNEQLREQNISTAQDLLGRVPSLVVGPNGTQRNAESITIRGQGQTYLAPVGVVTYFSEVPLIQGAIIANQGGPGNFFDVGSLQVLRGPQGTLFGRNTTGGALLVGPRRPEHRFEGYAQVQMGNYGNREVEGALSIPVVQDKLAVRVAGKYVKRDGFTKDAGPGPFGYVVTPTGASAGYAGKDYDDLNYWTGRIGVLWQPADGIENYLVAYNTKSHDNGSSLMLDHINPNTLNVATLAANLTFAPTNPNIFDPTTAQAIANYSRSLGPRRTALDVDQFSKLRVWSIADTFSADLSDTLTFRNVIAYQRMKQQYAWDLDGSILALISQLPGVVPPSLPEAGTVGARSLVTNLSQFTEEPQLHGNFLNGDLETVVGAFYSDQKPEGLQGMASFNVLQYSPITTYNIKTRSTALYAQGTFNFGAVSPALEGVRFTGGIRKTWEKVTGSRISANFLAYPDAAAQNKYDPITWTLGLDYKVSQDLLLFSKVARGYKAGGFNYAAPRPTAFTYKPEFVTSYEIGIKSDLRIADVPVRFNASAYHLDYTDLQRAAADNYPNGGLNASGLDQGAITFNARKARVQGIEVETMVQPSRYVQLTANYSYTDGKYKDFHMDVQADPLIRTIDSCDGPQAVPFLPGQSISIDLSCIPYAYTPKHQFNIGGRFEMPMNDDKGSIVYILNYAWLGKRYHSASTTPNDDPYAWTSSYGLLNLAVEWNSVLGSNFDARFFVNNLTDKVYRTSITSGYSQAMGTTSSMYGEPRMYGASLRYRFGN